MPAPPVAAASAGSPQGEPAGPPDAPCPIPPAADARVAAAYAQTAVVTAQDLGVAPAALAAALGWPEDALDAGRDSLPVADYIALLDAAARLANDPLFGLHVGLHARLSTYPYYGLVVCACTTLREAFAQTRRYEGLAHDLGRSRMTIAPAEPASGMAPDGVASPGTLGAPSAPSATSATSAPAAPGARGAPSATGATGATGTPGTLGTPGTPGAAGTAGAPGAAGVATYYWDCPWLAGCTPAQARHVCDSVLAGILTFVSWLAHERLPLLEIGLPYPAPEPAIQAAHQQVFESPVVYGVPAAYGRFDAALLDRPVPNADASMFKVLQRHAEELLAARLRETAEPRIVADVRREVAAQLANDRARLDEVAGALGLTARTLQRKLAEAGTSFQAVHDAARQALAEELLRDARLNLTDVAYLLGYREQSSFSRACREWFGSTPARTRERLRAAARG